MYVQLTIVQFYWTEVIILKLYGLGLLFAMSSSLRLKRWLIYCLFFLRPNVELLLPAAFPNKTYTLDLTEGKGDKKTGNIAKFTTYMY